MDGIAPQIGLFERKVSFCTVVAGKTEMGSASPVYTHSFYWYMNRDLAPSSLEGYVNKRLTTPGRYVYRGHYKAAINETMQIVDGSEKFNILQVNPIDRKMFIEVTVEKINP